MAEEIVLAAASEVATQATSDIYGLLKQQISYVFKYRSYISDLKNQVQELRNKREMVQRPVESAERQGDEIYQLVTTWLSDVDEFTEGVAKSIIEGEDKANKGCCLKLGSYPNLTQRYRLGKKAMKARTDGADLLGKGTFDSVSYRPTLQRTESTYVRGYEAFDSRMQVLQEIMDTLKEANVNMIGVYGMAGVGKSTLVRKVAWLAKENKLFDEVALAEVTQTPDYKKIQEKIAFDLGLEFGQESEYQRGGLLRNRIKKEKNVLVIFDDIWTKVDLDAIGIPFGVAEKQGKDDKVRRCTVLLTSRSLDVLSKDMKTQKNIPVTPLSYGDAWNLFRKIVGDSAESPDFHPVAVQIVTKCAGLPLAISTIAYALKNESLHAWEDTLAQLKRSNPRCTPGMKDTLYSTIERSYNLLKDEEAQSLFLLCGLYGEGTNIYIDDMLRYAIGWSLFQNVDTLEEGRNRLHSLIDRLKASCLLLDGDRNDQVKMHDIIHAVAVSIASSKFMFNIQNATGLEKKISKKSTAISLPYRDISDELPKRLECPELTLFWIFSRNKSLQIPDLFFEGMKEIKVLDLTGIHFLSLPPSLCCLKNIRTLCLDGCMLGDVTIIGELDTLEILSFLDSDIEELPSEIGQLTHLKLLDLSNCLKLKVIAPNVISCLSQLEDLYLGNTFVQWEVEGVNIQGPRRNASLGELKRLSNLTALHLHIQDARVMPRDLFFKKLKSYKIFIGDKWKWSRKYDFSTSRTFKLKINNSMYLGPGIKSLLKMTEDLSLEEMNGVRNVLYELDTNGFPHLKHIFVKDGLDLLYIIESDAWKLAFPKLESLILRNLINLEKICHGQLTTRSFSKLRIMKIEKCDRLEYLFASFMAKNLTQLQEIEVTDCKNLKEIFCEESKDHGGEIETSNKIEFNQLCSLTLQRLPQFIKISSDMMVIFPSLENLKLCSINSENTWLDQPLAMSSYSQCLKSLTVKECNGLKFLFSSSLVKSLNQLHKLVIGNCKSMEVIIDSKGEVVEERIIDISFPKLFCLKLKVLPKLVTFGIGNSIEFPSLIELHIHGCSNLKTFFCKSFYPDMVREEPEEEVNLENNFIDINPFFDEKVAFPSLEVMELLHMDNLQLIWHNQQHHVESFCKLKEVRVEFCKKLKTIVPSNSHRLLTFRNLERLTVKNCWGMKSLFPVSIAIGLMQLNDLRLVSCGLEKIVYEEEVNRAPIFLFPQLTFIKLVNLPELKCFYPGLHTIEWPKLNDLAVYDCKKIKIYDSEFPSFQKKDDGESQPAIFLLEKVMPNLKVLGLDAHDFTLTFLHSDLAESFCKLKQLILCNFDDESVASLFGFLQRLNCLESLCFIFNSFKELFPCEQGHLWKQDSQEDTFLQNLQTLEVNICHRLTILMSSEISFKNLTTLEACDCDGIANVLTCSAAKTLVNLTTMSIRNCKAVTEVIANEGDNEEEIVFGQLKVLELHCLSSLTFFCSSNYCFKFPFLEQVIASQCPKLNSFSQGVLSAPLLRRVTLTKEDDSEYFWNEDLNSTIQQMFIDMIGFPSLEYLKLSEFPTLKGKIWNGPLRVGLFCNVKWLVLDEVFDVSSAFPSHVLYDLKNLETLEIKNCHSLKVLFDIEGQTLKNNEEDILGFKNLKSLKVHNCGSLDYIFTPSIILGLDQLQEIEVKNCGLIEEIITKEEENKEVTPKIIIPHLKSIVLELLPHLTNFYSGTNDLECPSLQGITIANCPQMETFVFTDLKEKDYPDSTSPLFNEKVDFPSLEVMVLLHLDNLQLIWHNQQHHAESFCKLKGVRVEFCEKLETIVPSNSHRLLTFHNLERLTVENCWSMKSLFPVSIATGLMQLTDLSLFSCGLENIVSEEEVNGAPRFLFPQLTFIKLDNLPELKCFYPGMHTTEWPMLNTLSVYCCKNTKVYASEFPAFQNKDDGESQPAIFLLEKVIPNLEGLGLDAHDFKLTFLHIDLAESFVKLKQLWLSYFDGEFVASLSSFLQRLNCLESLSFAVNSFKELFPYEQGHMWKQDSQVDTFLQNLQTLEIKFCHLLTILAPSATGFKNIKTLEASYCDGLANVLTCSAAKTLVNLTTMRIRDCKSVTEVIANEGDIEEEIVFGQLKVLELHCLSSLTFFCSTKHSFKFLCLEQVIVSQCPKLEIFCQGMLSTPMLKKVQLTEQDDELEYFWKEDLNSTIKRMFTDMVGFRNFEHLTLSQFPNMKEKIWNSQVPIDLFWNLKSLVVDKFSDMSSVIPSHVLCHFKNLEMLDVRSCEPLEQVFDLEGLNANRLALEENRLEILGLQKLKSLKIDNCNSLRYIFTPYILLGLVQLQEIEVKNCVMIEEIIKEEGEEYALGGKIIIPQLNSVMLKSLPNLTSFYSGSDILECPPLKAIIIKDCQKIHMKEFSIHLASLFTVKVVLPSLEASSCFHNLTILVIGGFDHLKYLFPSSTIKSLFRLKKLKISKCKLMERIIDEDEERSSTMLFPKLYELKLIDLPKLTTFCNSAASFVEMSSLFRLWIKNCPGVQTFISNSICGGMTSSSKENEEMSANDNYTGLQSLFDKKVKFPNLERLSISHADELVNIWDDQVSLDSFCKLNRVFVVFCKKLVSVFPSNMLGSHQKLETLEVQNCDSVQEIFEGLEKRSSEMEEIVDKEEAIPRFVFSKFAWLSLQMLPSLKSLYPKVHISEWPILEVMKVYGCDNVEMFASEFCRGTHGESQQPLFLVYKDAFPSLEELELYEMPSLLHLWRGNSQPSYAFKNLKTLKVSECGSLENSWLSSVSFQNLETLQVSKCDGLRYLLTPLKAKTLDRLTRMNVSNCKMMEEIITHLRDEVLQDPIVFNRLDCLELHCLSSLKSFCCGDYTLEFSSLKKVTVRQCLKMETFCHGVLSTPKLQKIQLTEGENEVEECWEDNLNSTIQHLFKNNMNVQSSKED